MKGIPRSDERTRQKTAFSVSPLETLRISAIGGVVLTVNAESFVASFVAQLRGEAEHLGAFGAGEASRACSHIADELESAFRRWWLEDMTVAEAREESGYSEERLREMVREGTLPAGRNAPHGQLRLRRCDLPRRPRRRSASNPIDALAARLLVSK